MCPGHFLALSHAVTLLCPRHLPALPHAVTLLCPGHLLALPPAITLLCMGTCLCALAYWGRGHTPVSWALALSHAMTLLRPGQPRSCVLGTCFLACGHAPVSWALVCFASCGPTPVSWALVFLHAVTLLCPGHFLLCLMRSHSGVLGTCFLACRHAALSWALACFVSCGHAPVSRALALSAVTRSFLGTCLLLSHAVTLRHLLALYHAVSFPCPGLACFGARDSGAAGRTSSSWLLGQLSAHGSELSYKGRKGKRSCLLALYQSCVEAAKAAFIKDQSGDFGHGSKGCQT